MDKMKFGSALPGILKKSGKELGALVFAPAVIILLIGLLFAQGMQGGAVAVFNQDSGFEMPGMGRVSIPDQLIAGLDTNVIRVISARSEEEAFKLVKEGRVSVALCFPADLTQEMMIKLDDPSYVLTKKIRLSVDKSNPLVTALTAARIVSALAKNAQGLKLDSLPLPVDLSTLAEGGVPNIGAFVMPGIFMLLIFIISVVATAGMSLKLKTEDPALEGPGGNLALVSVFSAAIALQAALLFLTGIWVFKVTMPGNLALASLSILALVFCGVSLGTLFSSAVKKPDELPRAALPAVLPVFFAGALLPLELLPFWLRWICYLMPPYYAIQGFRGFTLYGRAGLWEWATLAILAALGIAFTLLAVAAAGRAAHEKKSS